MADQKSPPTTPTTSTPTPPATTPPVPTTPASTPPVQKSPSPQTPPLPKNPPATPSTAPKQKKHACAQWIFGCIIVLLLPGALITYGVYKITSEKVMKPMVSKTLNVVFRQNGMEETKRVVAYVNELNKNKEELKTFTKLDPTKIQNDISKMSPEQSQKYIDENIVNPMYVSGTKIIEPMKAVNTNEAADAERMDFLSAANQKSHHIISIWLLIQAGLLLITMIILVLVGYRFNRIYVPGIAILVGSLAGLMIFIFSGWLIKKYVPAIMGDYAKGPLYNDLTNIIVYPSIDILRNIHIVAASVGAGLLIIGLILGAIFKQHAPTIKPTPTSSPTPTK